jgi:hypothetical protein
VHNYFIDQGTISVPEAWLDESVNILSHPGGTPCECSLVISRGRLDEGEELEDFVSRQMNVLGESLSALEIVRREDVILDGERAKETEFSWVGEGVRFRQRQVCAVRQSHVLVLTATVSEDLYGKHWKTLDEIIFSFRFTRRHRNENPQPESE